MSSLLSDETKKRLEFDLVSVLIGLILIIFRFAFEQIYYKFLMHQTFKTTAKSNDSDNFQKTCSHNLFTWVLFFNYFYHNINIVNLSGRTTYFCVLLNTYLFSPHTINFSVNTITNYKKWYGLFSSLTSFVCLPNLNQTLRDKIMIDYSVRVTSLQFFMENHVYGEQNMKPQGFKETQNSWQQKTKQVCCRIRSWNCSLNCSINRVWIRGTIENTCAG